MLPAHGSDIVRFQHLRLIVAIRRQRTHPLMPTKTFDSDIQMQIRLAFVMLFLFAPVSCWIVTVASFIAANTGDAGERIFSEGFIGKAYGTSAVGALLTPLLVGRMADRWMAANRVMSLISMICGLLLWCMSSTTSETVFWWLMLCYSLAFSPILGLANVVCFRHLKDPYNQFPRIRAVATFSWVLGGWAVGYAAKQLIGQSIEPTRMPMQMGAVLHIALAGVCFVLPHTPPMDKGPRRSLLTALWGDGGRVLLDRRLFLPLASITLLSVASRFYDNFANVFLNDRGIANAAGHQAWGQVSELVMLLLIPLSLRRLGVKWTVTCGIAAWALRYSLLAIVASGVAQWLFWPAILLHGMAYSFTFLVLHMLADQVAPAASRSAAQGLIAVLTNGIGALVGAFVTSSVQTHWLRPNYSATLSGDWQTVWLIAAIIAAIPMLLMCVAYRKEAT